MYRICGFFFVGEEGGGWGNALRWRGGRATVLQLTRKLQRAVDRAERAGAQRDATVGRLEQSLAALASQVQGLAFLFEAGGAPARDEGAPVCKSRSDVTTNPTPTATQSQSSLNMFGSFTTIFHFVFLRVGGFCRIPRWV